MTYLGNGNLGAVEGPVNLNGKRTLQTYEYDPAVESHVAKITDNLGYASSATYNPKFGAIETSVDVNNNRTSYVYDAFGRVASLTGPYEQGGAAPTIRFDYHPDSSEPWARTRHFDRLRDPSGGDTIDTVQFTDGLGRVLQTEKDATIFTSPDSPPQDVMTVSGRVTFDFVGRIVQQRQAKTEPLGSPGAFNATPPDPVAPTVTEYDILDRATRLTIPDGTSTTTTYGFGADRSGTTQFEITVTDANGVQKKTYRDVQDLVTSIREFNQDGKQTIWTSYSYDPLEQITEVKDDKNNLTTMVYDNLGRRTVVDNPDTGRTETVYDLASNVAAEITANLRSANRRITYDYDAINRLVSITHPSFPDTNVTYTYGGPGAPYNRAGRISVVTDQSGSEERSYGKLGELTMEVKTVVGFTGNSPFTYTTEYASDTFGRLHTLKYPDAETLTYEYDSGGLVRRATGQKGGFSYPYVTQLEYDRFGERAFVEDGNGVRSQFSYRPDNQRLDNLRAGKPGATQFQNVKYEYDKVGNVVRLANDVAVPGPSTFGGPTVETFTYDDLYRLRREQCASARLAGQHDGRTC